jgi:hypothetical protein
VVRSQASSSRSRGRERGRRTGPVSWLHPASPTCCDVSCPWVLFPALGSTISVGSALRPESGGFPRLRVWSPLRPSVAGRGVLCIRCRRSWWDSGAFHTQIPRPPTMTTSGRTLVELVVCGRASVHLDSTCDAANLPRPPQGGLGTVRGGAAPRNQAPRDASASRHQSRRASRPGGRGRIRSAAAPRDLQRLPGQRTLAALAARPTDARRSSTRLPPLLRLRDLRRLRGRPRLRQAAPRSLPGQALRRGVGSHELERLGDDGIRSSQPSAL